MKELLTPDKAMENEAHTRSSMESSIVDTMHRYFRDDKGRMGDLELSIMDSVKKYFEEPSPKRIV
jgi:hypothetical protein